MVISRIKVMIWDVVINFEKNYVQIFKQSLLLHANTQSLEIIAYSPVEYTFYVPDLPYAFRQKVKCERVPIYAASKVISSSQKGWDASKYIFDFLANVCSIFRAKFPIP